MEKGINLRKNRIEAYIPEITAKDRGQYPKHKKKETEVKFTDKRRFRRHLLGLPSKYYLSGTEIGRAAFTVDISEEGLAIEFPEKLKAGDDLKLKILQKNQRAIEIM